MARSAPASVRLVGLLIVTAVLAGAVLLLLLARSSSSSGLREQQPLVCKPCGCIPIATNATHGEEFAEFRISAGGPALSVVYVEGPGAKVEQLYDVYFMHLMSRMRHPYVHSSVSGGEIKVRSNLMFVARNPVLPQIAEAVRRARCSAGVRNVGLFHTGDEYNDMPEKKLYSAFDYVVRHYQFPELRGYPKVYLETLGNVTCGTTKLPMGPAAERPANSPPHGVWWLPLGVRDKLPALRAETVVGARHRPMDCTFVGTWRRDRKEMVEIFKRSSLKCQLSGESGFGGSMGAFEYSQGLMNAKFTLCPFGNNEETHRMFEALRFGSIPVTRDCRIWKYFFERPPMVYVTDWNDAVTKVSNLLAREDELAGLQARAVRWYNRLEMCIQEDFGLLLERSFKGDYEHPDAARCS